MLEAKQLLVRIFDILLSVVVLLLGLRFTLKLIGANSSTPFVSWIYSLTESLTYPFSGIIQNPILGNGAVVDLVSLVSLLGYAIIGYLLISLIKTLTRPLTLRATRDEYIRS